MDFKQFQCFVTAAEEMHITRAATRLGIAQPVLSQQIKALEDRLGLRLFERKKRGIELTAAGGAFLAEARVALEQAHKAEQVAKRIAHGDVGVLEIGYVGSALFDPRLFPALTAYQRNHPRVRLNFRSMPPDLQLRALQDWRLDFAIVRSPLGQLADEFESFVFSSQRLLLALAAGHTFAARKNVALAALADDNFVSMLDPPDMCLGGALLMHCQEEGFVPNVVMHTSDITANISLVAAGAGASLVPDSVATLMFPNVRFVPIQKRDTRSDLIVVHRRYERSAALQELLSTIKEVRAQ